MTQEDILRMARAVDPFGEDGRLVQMAHLTPTLLRGFAVVVAAQERAACALLVESQWSTESEKLYGEELASAIRARVKL